MNIPWSWILALFFIVNLVIIGQSQWTALNPDEPVISETDAQDIISERYDGTVKKISLKNQLYHIEFEKENTAYYIKLDSLSGGVISFNKIED